MSTSAPLASERAAIITPAPSETDLPSGVNPRAPERDEVFEPLLLKLPIDQLCRFWTADVVAEGTVRAPAVALLLLHLTR